MWAGQPPRLSCPALAGHLGCTAPCTAHPAGDLWLLQPAQQLGVTHAALQTEGCSLCFSACLAICRHRGTENSQLPSQAEISIPS